MLLEKGADVNAVANHGTTPLDDAKNETIITLLKAAGAKFSGELRPIAA